MARWRSLPARARRWLGVAVLALAVGAGGAVAAHQATAAPSVVPGWPSSAGLPPAKAHLDQQMEARVAAARVKGGPPKPSEAEARAHIPTPWPSPTPRIGILAGAQGPFSAATFQISNAWQGWVGSTLVMVYAGVRHPGLDVKIDQGALRIDADNPYRVVGVFDAPTGPDALTITAANGNVLQLRTASGKTLSFNLQTHQYTAP